MDVGRIFACLPGEIHIDRIFGKHRDQSQKGDRQRLWNLELSKLRPPGKGIGGCKDCDAGREGVPRRRQMSPGELEIDPLQAEEKDGDNEKGIFGFRHDELPKYPRSNRTKACLGAYCSRNSLMFVW